MEAVSVDGTVQEKAVRFPTDAQLLYTAIVRLGMQARGAGMKLRQSYVRIGQRALIMVGSYGHARQFKRRNRHIRFLWAIILTITSIWQLINDKMENENQKYQNILQTTSC